DSAVPQVEQMLKRLLSTVGISGQHLSASGAYHTIHADIGNSALFQGFQHSRALRRDRQDAIDSKGRKVKGAVARAHDLNANFVTGDIQGFGDGTDGLFDRTNMIGPKFR